MVDQNLNGKFDPLLIKLFQEVLLEDKHHSFVGLSQTLADSQKKSIIDAMDSNSLMSFENETGSPHLKAACIKVLQKISKSQGSGGNADSQL